MPFDELEDLFGPGREPELQPETGERLRHGEPVWVVVHDDSSNVSEVIYWDRDGPAGASLGMRFHNGREYHYWGVPRGVYEQLLLPSHGEHHWELVRRGGYTAKRIV